jgi:UMF1 family MFS transporter
LAATLFGSQQLGLPDDKLIITVVIIQLVSIPGAMSMSVIVRKIWKPTCFGGYGFVLDYHLYLCLQCG